MNPVLHLSYHIPVVKSVHLLQKSEVDAQNIYERSLN